jgi:hypothetical protein
VTVNGKGESMINLEEGESLEDIVVPKLTVREKAMHEIGLAVARKLTSAEQENASLRRRLGKLTKMIHGNHAGSPRACRKPACKAAQAIVLGLPGKRKRA